MYYPLQDPRKDRCNLDLQILTLGVIHIFKFFLSYLSVLVLWLFLGAESASDAASTFDALILHKNQAMPFQVTSLFYTLLYCLRSLI